MNLVIQKQASQKAIPKYCLSLDCRPVTSIHVLDKNYIVYLTQELKPNEHQQMDLDFLSKTVVSDEALLLAYQNFHMVLLNRNAFTICHCFVWLLDWKYHWATLVSSFVPISYSIDVGNMFQQGDL